MIWRFIIIKVRVYKQHSNSNEYVLPAMSHAMIAGIEIEHVDPSKTLSRNIVNEQNKTVGDVSEWL